MKLLFAVGVDVDEEDSTTIVQHTFNRSFAHRLCEVVSLVIEALPKLESNKDPQCEVFMTVYQMEKIGDETYKVHVNVPPDIWTHPSFLTLSDAELVNMEVFE